VGASGVAGRVIASAAIRRTCAGVAAYLADEPGGSITPELDHFTVRESGRSPVAPNHDLLNRRPLERPDERTREGSSESPTPTHSIRSQAGWVIQKQLLALPRAKGEAQLLPIRSISSSADSRGGFVADVDDPDSVAVEAVDADEPSPDRRVSAMASAARTLTPATRSKLKVFT
jgi:hypothetical protein